MYMDKIHYEYLSDIYILTFFYLIFIQKDYKIIFTKENQRVVLFYLRSCKCVLNEDRRYSLILGGCVSRDLITPSYIFREAQINL
jgi:hypothetical protein